MPLINQPEMRAGAYTMRRLLNIILLTILLYIAYLAYKGDGVVDFREVLAGLCNAWNKIVAYFHGLARS